MSRRPTLTRAATRPRTTASTRPVPTRALESELLAGLGHGGYVAGMDEVGRGSLAGPVSVGVAVVGTGTPDTVPAGLADSKLLLPKAREDLVAPVIAWCEGVAVGHAGPDEIDELGIIAALRLAGHRALAELADAGLVPGVVILDGVHDWLHAPVQEDLFAAAAPPVLVPGTGAPVPTPPVRTQVKGDAFCAVVAAASVVAKVTRDALMVQADADHPVYGWGANKGYSSPEHIAALAEHGPSTFHRRSWHLPGVGTTLGAPAAALAGRA